MTRFLACLALPVMVISASTVADETRSPVNGAYKPELVPAFETVKGQSIARFDHSGWIGPMWSPGDDVDVVVIGKGVTLTGSILVPTTRKRPLIIQGEDRSTSRLLGSGTHQWIRAESPFARRHSAVFVDTPQLVTIRNLTSLNPDKYHFVGIGASRLLVEEVDIIDDRKAYTTDGVGGGAGTIIRNSFIDTYDDSIKIYAPGMLVENVTIVHNRNGAPLQFGWGGEQGEAVIRNLTVIANEPEIYNQGIFARAAQRGDANRRPLTGKARIEGFRLVLPKGMKVPPLFMWGTPDGLKLHDFTLEVTGLCSGPNPAYRKRAELTVVPRGSEQAVKLLTPDCG
jgi:hypothetical protein